MPIVVADTSYLGCKPIATPMEPNLRLSKDDDELFDNPSLYRRLIGKLLYLTITRSDFSYVVNRINQFLVKPRIPHYKDVQRVLQYVKATPGQGLFFPSNTNVCLNDYAEVVLPSAMDVQLKVFLDVDWIICPNTS